jgi:hypothetical protein
MVGKAATQPPREGLSLLAITVPVTITTPETAAFTANTSTSTPPPRPLPIADPLLLVGVVARCLRNHDFGLPILETHRGPVVNHQGGVIGYAIVATEGAAPSLRTWHYRLRRERRCNAHRQHHHHHRKHRHYALHVSPKRRGDPAGSPDQHRKALSGSVGRTDEQNLALDEQDLAHFGEICVDPASTAAFFCRSLSAAGSFFRSNSNKSSNPGAQ